MDKMNRPKQPGRPVKTEKKEGPVGDLSQAQISRNAKPEPVQREASRRSLARALPDPAPERIPFGSRLVLYKKAQTSDMALYVVHIKGKPTALFVMDKLDPATSIAWRGAFRKRSGVILADRDGVVKDSRFLNDTAKESAKDVMVESALQAAKRANEANIGIGIVTNQGGYQAGKMSFEDTVAINVRVIQQIANAGGHVDAVFICPFNGPLQNEPAGVYDARKPGPGMFLFAEQLARVNKVPVLAATGDQRTDGAAAQAAGQFFYAITGSSGRWWPELKAAEKKREELPKLDRDPARYREVGEFAEVVEAVLAERRI